MVYVPTTYQISPLSCHYYASSVYFCTTNRNNMKIILTGATGFVGEGILLACLDREEVEKVLSVSRRPCEISHPKLEEYIVEDFMTLPVDDPKLQGYDACFFCAGKSNIGMSKDDYYHLSYEIRCTLRRLLVRSESLSLSMSVVLEQVKHLASSGRRRRLKRSAICETYPLRQLTDFVRLV